MRTWKTKSLRKPLTTVRRNVVQTSELGELICSPQKVSARSCKDAALRHGSARSWVLLTPAGTLEDLSRGWYFGPLRTITAKAAKWWHTAISTM